jgi:hypothetical protein
VKYLASTLPSKAITTNAIIKTQAPIHTRAGRNSISCLSINYKELKRKKVILYVSEIILSSFYFEKEFVKNQQGPCRSYAIKRLTSE